MTELLMFAVGLLFGAMSTAVVLLEEMRHDKRIKAELAAKVVRLEGAMLLAEGVFRRACDTAIEALRQGTPSSELGKVMHAAVDADIEEINKLIA